MSKELDNNTDFSPKQHAQEMVEHYQKRLDEFSKIYHNTSKQVKEIEKMLAHYKEQL